MEKPRQFKLLFWDRSTVLSSKSLLALWGFSSKPSVLPFTAVFLSHRLLYHAGLLPLVVCPYLLVFLGLQYCLHNFIINIVCDFLVLLSSDARIQIIKKLYSLFLCEDSEKSESHCYCFYPSLTNNFDNYFWKTTVHGIPFYVRWKLEDIGKYLGQMRKKVKEWQVLILLLKYFFLLCLQFDKSSTEMEEFLMMKQQLQEKEDLIGTLQAQLSQTQAEQAAQVGGNVPHYH